MGRWARVVGLGMIGLVCGWGGARTLRGSDGSAESPKSKTGAARLDRAPSRAHAREIDQLLAGGGQQQVSEVLAFLDRLGSGEDCRSFALHLIGDPAGQSSKTLWGLVLARWSTVDPEGMMDFVDTMKWSGRGRDLEPMAWFAWAASDPVHLASLAPRLEKGDGLEVLRGLAAVDPDLALDVAFRMPDANGAVNRALRATNRLDPQRLQELMTRAVYDGMRNPMQDALRDQLLTEDPRKAVEFSRNRGRTWSDPVAATLGMVAQLDAEEAVTILDEMPSSRGRAIATVEVVKNWSMKDPAAALDWIRSQPPGVVRNTSLVRVASIIGGEDPLGGLALIEEVEWSKVGAFYSIGAVNSKGRLLNQVQEHGTVQTLDVARDLLRSLAGTDPDGARAYVADSVPAEYHQELLQVIGEGGP